MKKIEKMICDFMADFFENNFDKIKYDLSDSNLPTNKKDFIKIIKTDVQDAMWALTELCRWGMDKKYHYLNDIFCDTPDCDFSVIKIADVYIKMIYNHETHEYLLEETFPKEKTIIYFD
jgi:hypothetical protein